MKKLLKDIWFYIKDFFTKTPLYMLFTYSILVLSLLAAYLLISIADIISLGLGCYDCLSLLNKEPVLTEEQINNKLLYFSFLLIYITGFATCTGLIFLVRRLRKKFKL